MKKTIYLLVILVLLRCNNFSNIIVFNDYEKGLLNAAEHNQNVLLVFDFLGNPKTPARGVIYYKEFERILKGSTVILLYVDKPGKEGVLNRKLQKEKYGTDTQPTYYILDNKGKIIKGPLGYCREDEFGKFIQQEFVFSAVR